MEYGYIVKLSNKNLYKEIQIPYNYERMGVGMDIDCDVRLYKDVFFDKFRLDFSKEDGCWQVVCSDNVYIDEGNVIKKMMTVLDHGSVFKIRYRDSDNEVVQVEFMFDFDNENKNYDCQIDIGTSRSVVVGGGENYDISLHSQYTAGDKLVLKTNGNTLQVAEQRARYGVYHNGKRVNAGETIKSGDFLSIADISFYFKDGKLYTENSDKVYVRNFPVHVRTNGNDYPKFNRNTRIKEIVSDEKIEVLDPPAKPQEPKNNLFTRLLPSLGMLVAAGVMAFMGGAMVIMSAISGVMSIVTAVIGVRESKKDFKKGSEDRLNKYNNYIANKRKEIENFRSEEREALERIYVSQNVECERFREFSSDLFDRQPEDDDFLTVRLGTGEVEAKREISYKKQERLELEDDLQLLPEQISDEFKNVQNAPIVCDLKAINALGVVGEENCRFNMMKNMVLDLCARHYQSNLSLVFVAKEENKDKVYWLRMLPHVHNDVLDVRNIVCNDESKNLLFDYLYKELSLREQNKHFERNIVVFFYDEYGFKNHPISKFVEKAMELGVTFVFFGENKADIPQGCGYIAETFSDGTGVLTSAEDKNKSSKFEYPHISDENAKKIVDFLAPVYTEEISLEGDLTKNITLFELLNIIAVDDIDLESRWNMSQVYKSMAAPIGVTKSAVISLDLHDKAHGPHGLVAGTTGSGKSEILQTYILSMATLFNPYEVSFVIIDFKGGGMVNQFKDLPHLLGAITNIDGKEINRSLKSIKAELQKRQRLFAEADVNHIDKYIKKYKNGEVATPLPHLIVIVDEFAELKAEQPEFMKELISAARIGRSLGVHLILATQKPSGQVNEQIWSNSRFKLCLKVQSQEDSNEVLKSPLAAEIKEPGRAYLQVGNNEVFELFQSAYSGAPEKNENANVKSFSILNMLDSGKKVPVFVQKKKSSAEGNITQLDAIVKYVHDYCEKKRIVKLPDICLPSLAENIEFPKGLEPASRDGIRAAIGIYDDPDNQYQGVYEIDLANTNVMLIGSAQSGKTNVLNCIVRNLAERYSPNEVNIYIMDFASMALKVFEPLAHVGGVVTSADDEKLKNLIKLLYSEIETRKEKLVSIGVSSFSAYREAGKTDLPQIVLLIDNLTAVKELYFKDDDEILGLCRDGLSVGISVVIANSQTSGIGYKYLSNFATRIAMFSNDAGEYSALFDHCRERLDDIHGRCLVDIDKEHLECQSFHAFGGEKEIDRVKEIKAFISDTNKKYPREKAQIIPVIPAVLTSEFVEENYLGYMQNGYSVVVGLDYGTVGPLAVPFSGLGAVAVSGRESSGKHNFIRYCVNIINRMYPDKTSVHIVDGIGKKLAGLALLPNVMSYDFIAEKAVDVIKNVESTLKNRYDSLASGELDSLDDEKLILVVINSPDAVEAICADSSALNAYKNITGKYKNMNALVIVGNYENVNVPYSAPEIIKKLKESRQFFFFDDIANLKIIDMPLAVVRNFKKPIEQGDCYFIKDNECWKLKTAISR